MHIVIVGVGTVGVDLAVQLRKGKHDVSVVDVDPVRCAAMGDKLDILVVQGSGSSPKALEQAGIRRADTLLAVTSVDEVNILACGLAAQYEVPRRIARIRSTEFVDPQCEIQVNSLGVTEVIDPEHVVVRVIEQIVRVPEAVEVFSYHDGEILICRHIIREDMPVSGKTLASSAAAVGDHHMLAVALKRGEEAWIPGGDDVVHAGDDLTTVMPRSSLHAYEELLDLTSGRVGKVVVAGATRTAVQLCATLKKWVEDVTLIDPDAEHGLAAAETLDGVEVIHGDPTERDVLREVNAGGADFYVGVGEETTHNVMGALLARSEGAREVLAVSAEPGSNQLYREIGVDHVVSPRRAMAQEIMDMLQRGRAAVELQLRDMDLESAELCAEEGSKITQGPLFTVWQPVRSQAIAGAVVRNGAIFVPSGGTEIQEGDEVVVITQPRAIDKIRRLFVGSSA